MSSDYLTKFEVKAMLNDADWEDEEGMLYLAAKIRELDTDIVLRDIFELYCRLFDDGITQFNLTPYDTFLGLFGVAGTMAGISELHNAIGSVVVAAAWHKYIDATKEG